MLREHGYEVYTELTPNLEGAHFIVDELVDNDLNLASGPTYTKTVLNGRKKLPPFFLLKLAVQLAERDLAANISMES